MVITVRNQLGPPCLVFEVVLRILSHLVIQLQDSRLLELHGGRCGLEFVESCPNVIVCFFDQPLNLILQFRQAIIVAFASVLQPLLNSVELTPQLCKILGIFRVLRLYFLASLLKRDDVINKFSVLRPEIGVKLHHTHAEVISFDAHIQHRAVCISFFLDSKFELIIADPEICHLRHVFLERSKHRLRLSSHLLLHLILEVELHHGFVKN